MKVRKVKLRHYHIVNRLANDTRVFFCGDDGRCKRFISRSDASGVAYERGLTEQGYFVEPCDCGPRPPPSRQERRF